MPLLLKATYCCTGVLLLYCYPSSTPNLAVHHREKPDLAIFTGDNIWYSGNPDIAAALIAVTKPFNDAKVWNSQTGMLEFIHRWLTPSHALLGPLLCLRLTMFVAG